MSQATWIAVAIVSFLNSIGAAEWLGHKLRFMVYHVAQAIQLLLLLIWRVIQLTFAWFVRTLSSPQSKG